jgi:hypothetical protein
MVRPGPDSTDAGASFVDYGRSLLSGLAMVWCRAVFGNDRDWRGHQAAIASAAIEGHGGPKKWVYQTYLVSTEITKTTPGNE